MQNYNPHAAFHEQPWHTVATLREVAREQAQQIANLTGRLAACDSLDRVEQTPQAWRIYGAIEHYLSKGYDADHIIRWLDAGAAQDV